MRIWQVGGSPHCTAETPGVQCGSQAAHVTYGQSEDNHKATKAEKDSVAWCLRGESYCKRDLPLRGGVEAPTCGQAHAAAARRRKASSTISS